MFQRGFKSWCEEISQKIRLEHKLLPSAPLDPTELARSLGVFLITPYDLQTIPQDVCARLATKHSDCWSAVTISSGSLHLIIYNPEHSARRRANDLMHELAHILLKHKPTFMFIAPGTGAALRTYDKSQEEEANWLAGCLLLPRMALLSIRRQKLTDEQACLQYGISTALLQYRLNVSGVNVQFRRGSR